MITHYIFINIFLIKIHFPKQKKNSEKSGKMFSLIDDRFSYLLLCSICCDISHKVASGKLHCTLMTE